ncbi:MAG: hypothetical protein HN570_03985 [Verrucomicrobia bacterium]|jgi:hypothetical protein|nr:hypothetical protein [Verrucomicrobiota bacterium]MDA7655197.1 hypothetical protein [Akkermansiaceae bacterium]MBT7216736.1 hypothetical protein [Verrucomicrobiota bacterium]MBT7970133.1 hypothetical protein [Verrucomicrobiota bacterium]MDB4708331.1 hypothetical protein [Akkermansiaceae bacterium]
MKNETMRSPDQLIAWVIWGAILMGLFVLQFFIGGGIPTGDQMENPPTVMSLICIAGVAIGTLIRWLVIPKLNDNLKLLPAMIVGLALCESSGLLQMFLLGKEYPDTQKLIFVLAVLGVVQFAPTYFKKA